MPEKNIRELIDREFSKKSSSEKNEIIKILKETMPLNLPRDYLFIENKEEYLNKSLNDLEREVNNIKPGEKKSFLEKGYDVRSNSRILGYLFFMQGLYEKAELCFNYASKFGDMDHKNYEVLLKEENRDGISKILKEFYFSALNSSQSAKIEITEIYKKESIEEKIGKKNKGKVEKDKEGIKSGIIIGTGLLIVALGSGTIVYNILSKKFESKLKEESAVYEQKIQELISEKDSIAFENSELEKQILDLTEQKDAPVYAVSMLGKDETITYKVAEYLDLILGKHYDELTPGNRIKLINDFTKILYNVKENQNLGLSMYNVRNLPEKFYFYIPISSVGAEKTPKGETWIITGKYNDSNNKIREYKFSGIDY